jgi:hypothetical protein
VRHLAAKAEDMERTALAEDGGKRQAGFRHEFSGSTKGGIFSMSFGTKMLNHRDTSSCRCFPPSKRRYNHFHRNLQRYEDNIKMGVRDVNWIQVAQDIIQHSALVLGVLNEFNSMRDGWRRAG